MTEEWVTDFEYKLHAHAHQIKDLGHSLLVNEVDKEELEKIKKEVIANLERLDEIIVESYEL